MIVFPNCKINLGLSVTQKRDDGFHNIETVLYPVDLRDILEIIQSPDNNFGFKCTGLEVKGDIQQNLVVKAYQLLKDNYDLPEVHIQLHKIIPSGAGLGGGSSDAAFTILLLNNLFKLNLSRESMENHARKLGSDCAFFIRNRPVFAYEKGDRFEDIDLDLSPFRIVLIKPVVQVRTPAAYVMIKPETKEPSVRQLINLPHDKWQKQLLNDFEKPIFKMHPEIQEIKTTLLNLGAEYAAMSGSGAAVFGLFRKPDELKAHFPDCFVWGG